MRKCLTKPVGDVFCLPERERALAGGNAYCCFCGQSKFLFWAALGAGLRLFLSKPDVTLVGKKRHCNPIWRTNSKVRANTGHARKKNRLIEQAQSGG